ncbi:hypothetical protein CEY12_00825 [Chryseobacterium sp. T16E-39]|nr:hypothetical protein CEY12_00825 [Chryseobacterium sp. T16E-39]
MLACFNVFSQTIKNNGSFSINPFINSFIENLINKETNLDKNYLTLISLIDKDGNYNIDLELTTGSIETLKVASSKEEKLAYGNIKVLLIGKTSDDLKFLKRSIKKTIKVFTNKDLSKNNMGFFDEDYVWSTFFDKNRKLIYVYIPEEKESADEIFKNLKTKIRLSPKFRSMGCNCF